MYFINYGSNWMLYFKNAFKDVCVSSGKYFG